MDISLFKIGLTITPKNKMDDGKYSYTLTAPYGQLPSNFKPHFTPQQMLQLGVFEGKYLNDCQNEFPKQWFQDAKIAKDKPDVKLNYFQIKSRMSLKEWKIRQWIIGPDNRGWFQWYCRYFIGRRIPDIDDLQIKRWRAFRRHLGQVHKNCPTIQCRPKQRQALLQWAHNAFITSNDILT